MSDRTRDRPNPRGRPDLVGALGGIATVKAFDLGPGRTGVIDHATVRAAEFDPVSDTNIDPIRAEHYPDTHEPTVHLVADRPTERVLGASVVARQGAKRIDTVVTAIQAGLTDSAIEGVDLADASPFGPDWGPILTAGKGLAEDLDAPA